MRQHSKILEKDADTLDRKRANAGAYSETIIREQSTLIDAANDGIKKLNADMKSLRLRLTPYTTKNPKDWDSTAIDLKFRYGSKLSERATLERAREIATESIAAAKLNMIPGELDRTPRAPNEKNYNGLEM